MKHIMRARLLIPATLGNFRFGINVGYVAYGWSSLPSFGVTPVSTFMLVWNSARRWEALFVVVTVKLILLLLLLWLLVVVDTDYRFTSYVLLWAIGLFYC